jgi:two-component system NtrC family sensor kinase
VDGVLGIRIRVERQTISDQLKAIATSSSMLNHAIRNRLAIMDLSLDHIHVEATKHQLPEISQYADVAMLEIKQMQSMIERIHKQLNEIRVVMKPARCSELVNSVIEGFQQLPMASRIVIHRSFAVDPIVLCDEAHVSELILNLLKNAAEAMGIQGGTIHIRFERDRKGIMIAVSDNGPGIPKQDVSRVFEPFYSTKKRNANFGLGLTYCYMVAQAHEGTLSVASEQGKGTTFTLRLPKKCIISDEFEMERVIERGVGQIGIG